MAHGVTQTTLPGSSSTRSFDAGGGTGSDGGAPQRENRATAGALVRGAGDVDLLRRARRGPPSPSFSRSARIIAASEAIARGPAGLRGTMGRHPPRLGKERNEIAGGLSWAERRRAGRGVRRVRGGAHVARGGGRSGRGRLRGAVARALPRPGVLAVSAISLRACSLREALRKCRNPRSAATEDRAGTESATRQRPHTGATGPFTMKGHPHADRR